MKTKPSQNIYDTRGSQRPEGESASPGHHPGGMDAFILDLLRRQQRQAFHIYVVVGVAGVLLAGMIAFWFSTLRRPQHTAQSEAATNVAEISYTLNPGGTPALYLIDPLKQIIPVPLQTNAPAELSAEWIKQTVYHLLQAEKAAANDRLDAALEEYFAALKIYPTLKGVHKQLGLIYL
ncbi:MAG: hypothetical protein NTV49_03235, partial [Kiritimatiellaeota bacterium]|nr:hypothetical protein [Kiritimatiellota bacterium]